MSGWTAQEKASVKPGYEESVDGKWWDGETRCKCGAALWQNPRGRLRKFCSSACRQAAWRDREWGAITSGGDRR